MTLEEKEYWEDVKYRMDAEGFHYCFYRYSNFPEIKDEKFHELRKEYLKSAELLKKYINEKCEEETDDDE